MSKQIVVVVESIDVNDSSGSKVNVALIKNLSALGYNITVLHYTRKTIDLNGITCIAIKEKKYTLFYMLSRVQRILQRIFRLNLAKYLEPVFGFSFTFFNDTNSIKTALKQPFVANADLIITLSKGASFRPHYAINQFPHLYEKWMAYIHDPYPLSHYPPPYRWKEPGHKQKQRFFKSVSEHAKYSAFPSQLLQDWVGGFFPDFNKTGMIIPHQSIDIDLKDVKTPEYFDNTKFNILHAGSLLQERNPEGLITGFQKFLENNPEAKQHARLLLLGSASYHNTFLKACEAETPELFLKLFNVPFKEVYWLQKLVCVNVILEANAEISPFLPGKFPHCVSANKPILHLGPENSETKRLLGKDYAYHTTATDSNNIANCITVLYNLWLKNDFKLELNRTDLEHYVSKSYLKEVIS